MGAPTRYRIMGLGLSKEVWSLIIINTIMSTIFNFTGIFVNLYLWGTGQSIVDVTLFNLIMSVVLFFAYLVGSHYLYKRSVRFVIGTACVAAAMSFATLCFYTPHDHYWIISLVGILAGVTQGTFWAGNNSAMFSFLKSEDFRNYFSANTVASQIITILVPLMSSGLIFLLGYKGSFLTMGVVVLAALVFVARLPNMSISESLFIKIRYKDVFSKPGTRWTLPAILAAAAMGQFQGFFSMIFTFNITNNQVVVALLNVGYAIVLFGALVLYKRLSVRENLWLVIGIVLILAGYVIAMTHHPSLAIAIVLLMQVGGLYFSASSGRQGYRVAMQGDLVWRTRLGMWQELPYFVSRVVVLGLALMFHHVGDIPFIILIAISTLSMFLMPYFQYKSIYEFEEVHGVGAGM